MRSFDFSNSNLKSLQKGYFWQTVFVFLIIVLFGADAVGQQIGLESFTPLEWQPKLGSKWNRDANNNNVEDDIESLKSNALIDIILCLNQCPRSDDSLRFEQKGNVRFVGKFLSVIVMDNVKVSDAVALGGDNLVAMVQLARPVELRLSISNPAIKVKQSGTYDPNTVWATYPDVTGGGVNIAILDEGVDDGVHESLPAAKFVGGYDAVADVDGDFLPEVNPNDNGGHGTHVAGIACGQGAGPGSTFRGIAPDAGLVDILTTTGADLPAATFRAVEKCIQRRNDWNIRVINMSFGQNIQSNGQDALSQYAERAVLEDIVVTVAIAEDYGLSGITEPEAADDVIAVAASSYENSINRGNDQIADFSNAGPRLDDGDADPNDEQKPDVAAPGTDLNPFAPGRGVNSAQFNTFASYWRMAGTSMSAPHVAGLAALIIGVNPNISALSVKKLIVDCAEDKGVAGWDGNWGWGLVDGFCAIDRLKTELATTDLGFNDFCHEPGNDLWWLSSDITTANPQIKEGVPNTIRVTVTNYGPATSLPFRVRIGVYPLGNSLGSYTIGEVPVGALAFPGNSTIELPWTPQESFDPPTLHVCVKAQIIYPFDTNAPNNCAQRNIDIEGASSPVKFRMLVTNPTGKDLKIHLLPLLSDSTWKIRKPETFTMKAFECPRPVEITLIPPDPTAPPCTAFIFVRGDSSGIPALDLGGVALVGVNCLAIAGDANGDNQIRLSDIRALVHFLHKKNEPVIEPICRYDVNGDGKFNMKDVVYLVKYLNGHGPAPVKSGACCL